jgi:HTH-type transcriptional regulator/antitoxin HigA
MHIITRKRLNEFAARHPDTHSALEHWYREMKHRSFASFAELRSVWAELANTIFVPHGEADCRRLVAFLDRLIDEVGEDEAHPLASLMELVGVLIERYEDENVPELTGQAQG